MWELLKTIALCTKKLFTEWLPTLLNADLGPIGEMKDVIGIIGLVLIFSSKNQIHSSFHFAQKKAAELAGQELRYNGQQPCDNAKNTMFHIDTPFESAHSNTELQKYKSAFVVIELFINKNGVY